MIRNLLTGVAALALMTGAAYAQDSNYYSDTRSVTSTTPFGSSRTVTTTTSQAAAPVGEDVDAAPMPPPPPPGYDEQSADLGDAPPPPPNYRSETTTRQLDPYGNEIDRTQTVQKRQTFYDGDGELTARTTTQTRNRVTTYGPPVVYRPSAAMVGPSPSTDLPPYQRTTTTTTITDDGE
jgi:hypothetical protein